MHRLNVKGRFVAQLDFLGLAELHASGRTAGKASKQKLPDAIVSKGVNSKFDF